MVEFVERRVATARNSKGALVVKLACVLTSIHRCLMLRDEGPTPEQIAILRRMTGTQKLRVAEQMYWSARRMKAAGLRALHPDWSEEQVEREVTRIFLHARS